MNDKDSGQSHAQAPQEFDIAIQKLLKISKGMSRPVYRGQSDASWEIVSGAVRRINRSLTCSVPTY